MLCKGKGQKKKKIQLISFKGIIITNIIIKLILSQQEKIKQIIQTGTKCARERVQNAHTQS